VEPLTEAFRLLRRQSELEEATRRPGGIRVTEGREVYQLKDSLQKYPAAVRAIVDASKRLQRPVDALSFQDIETGQQSISPHEPAVCQPPTDEVVACRNGSGCLEATAEGPMDLTRLVRRIDALAGTRRRS
jgi:hypothetical protein